LTLQVVELMKRVRVKKWNERHCRECVV
jgi:hypothetical protein